MKLQIKDGKIIIRPQDEREKAICYSLLHGKQFTVIKRVDDLLYFKPSNMLLFDHDELQLEKLEDRLILRPLTKSAEQLCMAILGGGGHSLIEWIAPSGYKSYLRSIATNPITGNPWRIDGVIPRKDITCGDFEDE